MCEYNKREVIIEMYINKTYLEPPDILGISLRPSLRDGLSYFFKSLKTSGHGTQGLRAQATQRLASSSQKDKASTWGLGLEVGGRRESCRSSEEPLRVQLRMESREEWEVALCPPAHPGSLISRA